MSNMRRRLHTQLLLLTGIVGPLTFVITVIVVASFRPDYNHVNQFMSELGEAGGQYASAMNYLGFMLPAALILTFVLAFRTCLPRTFRNNLGAFFLAVFAISMFMAGVFSCDVGCSPAEPTRNQQLHDLFSFLAFPAFTIGVFTWGLSLFRMPGWRRFGVYTLVTAILSLVLLVAMVQSEVTREGTGIYQRLYLGVLFLWLAMIAVRLLTLLRNGRIEQAVK